MFVLREGRHEHNPLDGLGCPPFQITFVRGRPFAWPENFSLPDANTTVLVPCLSRFTYHITHTHNRSYRLSLQVRLESAPNS